MEGTYPFQPPQDSTQENNEQSYIGSIYQNAIGFYNWIFPPSQEIELSAFEKFHPQLWSHASAMAWILKGFEKINPQSVPEFVDGHFAALMVFFESFEKKAAELELPCHDFRELHQTFFSFNCPELPLGK